MPDEDDSIEPDLREGLGRVFVEVAAYFDELEGESSRAAAILAVAALEDELDALLRTKFPDSSDKQWKRLTGPGLSPFGTLKAKTDVAEVFGFFGPKTCVTINRITQVRNKFAHRKDIRDFDHPDVLKICRELADNPVFPYTLIEKPQASDIRWHFTITVKDLIDRLSDVRAYIPELDDPEPKPLP